MRPGNRNGDGAADACNSIDGGGRRLKNRDRWPFPDRTLNPAQENRIVIASGIWSEIRVTLVFRQFRGARQMPVACGCAAFVGSSCVLAAPVLVEMEQRGLAECGHHPNTQLNRDSPLHSAPYSRR